MTNHARSHLLQKQVVFNKPIHAALTARITALRTSGKLEEALGILWEIFSLICFIAFAVVFFVLMVAVTEENPKTKKGGAHASSTPLAARR